MKTNRVVFIALLLVTMLFVGCAHKTSTDPTASVSPEQRILQFNQIVSTTNSNLVPVLAALKDTGVIKPELVAKIAAYQNSVAVVTSGIASVMSQPGSWADRAIQLQNLALSQIPPSGYSTFGVQTDSEFKALVLAIDGMESTIQIIVQMAQQQALAAPAK